MKCEDWHRSWASCCVSPVLLNLYSAYLTEEVLEGFGYFKIGGQIIRTVKCTENAAPLAEEETLLIEIGRRNGVEMNEGKNN